MCYNAGGSFISKNRIWTSKRQIHKNKGDFIFVMFQFGAIPNPLSKNVRGEHEVAHMPREREAEYNKSRRKSRKVTFRVSEEEYDMIKENAEKCLLPVNTYLLHMVKDGVIIIQNYEGLSELANAINRIGVNINQIAHYANEYGYVEKGDWQVIREKMCEVHTMMMNTIRTNTGKGLERKKRVIKEKLKEKKADGLYQKH